MLDCLKSVLLDPLNWVIFAGGLLLVGELLRYKRNKQQEDSYSGWVVTIHQHGKRKFKAPIANVNLKSGTLTVGRAFKFLPLRLLSKAQSKRQHQNRRKRLVKRQ